MKLTLEKPIYGGDCLAHSEGEGGKGGKAIFVPIALPGETVSAHIIEEKPGHASAELDEVLTPSPNRIPPPCPYFGLCGGCHYQHADYPTQLSLKAQILRETLTRAKVPIPSEIAVLAAEPWAYRNRIRLALTADGSIGYRSRRSHAVVPIAECPIAAPLLMDTALNVAAFLRQHRPSPPITEIELFTNSGQSQLLLTLHFGDALSGVAGHPWLPALHRSLPVPDAGLSLRHAGQPLSADLAASMGDDFLDYPVSGFSYRVNQGAFFQVNRWLLEDFVRLVVGHHAGKTAWDIYAGVGLFARQFTASFTEVIAVESALASVPALQHNLTGPNAWAIPSTTLDYLRRNREQREPRPDLIVLDPPRAGLGPEVTTLLNQIHAPEMVYVSCDPATLARDLRALTQERYHIQSMTLADMFPQTFHIETVVKLRRS